MPNVIADFLRSQEDREDLRKIEQLRRKGEVFIKVVYQGTTVPAIGSDGVCYNIRMHGLRDLVAFEQSNLNTGQTEWNKRVGAKAIAFRQSSSGDLEADIWDDPQHWNRRFIATHPELHVVDDILRKEVAAESGKPFKAELSRKEEIEQAIAENVRELDKINKEEQKNNPKLQKSSKKGPKEVGVNGVNDSTSGVDIPGVPRVATRGNGKRDPSAVQSSPSDP